MNVKSGLLKVEAGGNFQDDFNKTVKDCEVHVDGFAIGPTISSFPNAVDKMIEAATTFPKKTENPNTHLPIKALVRDYGLIWPDDNNIPDFNNPNRRREKMIERCAILKGQANTMLEQINESLGQPKTYTDEDWEWLLQKQEQLNGLLSEIEKSASDCLDDPWCNTNINLKLPDMKDYPNPKSPVSNTEISEKYRKLQKQFEKENVDFLGKPLNEEEKSSDGVGRLKLFENGGIFWHPNTDAREVHGVIFKAYIRRQIDLGYPRTDQINLPNGQIYNKFQGGEIWSHIDRTDADVTLYRNQQYVQHRILARNIRTNIKPRFLIAKDQYLIEELVKYPNLLYGSRVKYAILKSKTKK